MEEEDWKEEVKEKEQDEEEEKIGMKMSREKKGID